VKGIAPLLLLATGLLAWSGCGESHPTWREQKLPSGRVVKLTMVYFGWGVEHDERTVGNDGFAVEFVCTQPDAPPDARAREAKEVFELIRPISEQWDLKLASVAGFPSVTRKGKYDLYLFRRDANGAWKSEHEERKVFATD